MQVAQQIFVAKKWVHDTRNKANAANLTCANVEKSLRAFKQEQAELSEKLKKADQTSQSAEAGLKTIER